MKSTEKQIEQNEREVNLANAGKQVLNNVAYVNAITLRKARIFEVFCKTNHEQDDVREEAWRTMQNLSALEDYFNHILTTGKMAEESLKLTNK